MGWNSWDSFAHHDQRGAGAATIAAIMAEKLLPHGYDIFTIDIQWYEPGATELRLSPTKPSLTMDG